jgi:hypothetical protein
VKNMIVARTNFQRNRLPSHIQRPVLASHLLKELKPIPGIRLHSLPRSAKLTASTPIAADVENSRAFAAIFSAGLLCGVMDITAAFITWWPKGVKPPRLLQGVAAGWLGPKSFDGGMATASLGLAFHFLIAFTAATIFYVASRQLAFMIDHPVVSGVLYGIAVYLVMYWAVMPLSNFHGTKTVTSSIVAIITHIVCVGLPISLVIHRFSR